MINWKGGVGKTTCAINLAAEWAIMGNKVLVIDIDAQASASVYLYTEVKYKEEYYNPIAEAFKNRNEVKASKEIAIQKSIFGIFADVIHDEMAFNKNYGVKCSLGGLNYLDLIPSTFYLNELSQLIVSASSTEGISSFNVMLSGLKRHGLLNDYDYIIIDCPPNLNLITLNAIFASDYFLIPTVPDLLSTLGLPLLIRRLQTVKKRRNEIDNKEPKLLGIILTKVSHQLRGIQTPWISVEIPWMLKRFIEDDLVWEKARLFENQIKEMVAVQRAVEESKPLCTSKQKNEIVRIQFQNLAKEILDNLKTY